MTIPVYQWQPSTAEIAAAAGIAPRDVVRFDHNTSPFGPPWADEVAAAAAGMLNEYPAADYTPLRRAAAGYAGVTADQVVPGAGVDEMIDLCARAFLPRGGTAVATSPTYPLYRIATMRQGAAYTAVPRSDPGLAFPAGDLVRAAAGADLVWLCLPDNPFGDRAPDDAVAAVIEGAAGIVVIDAAYGEFAGDGFMTYPDRYPNVVVLHTMSKAFGLAGIRVGYSISRPDLAARLHDVRPPGSISTMSAELAIRALTEPAYAAAIVADITSARSVLAGRLGDLGFAVRPSVANFLLCRVGRGAGAMEQALMGEGIVVRSYATGPLHDHLRFTVRSPAENDRLIDALRRNLP